MKSEEYVRKQYPNAELKEHHGAFVGGTVRYEVWVGRKMVGCSTGRPSWAWADAMRHLKEAAR